MKNSITITTLFLLLSMSQAWGFVPCKGHPSEFNACEGTHTFDGGTYKGEYRNGVPHGRGILTNTVGSTYVGQWRDGEWDGRGTFTRGDNGVEQSGIWKGSDLLKEEDQSHLNREAGLPPCESKVDDKKVKSEPKVDDKKVKKGFGGLGSKFLGTLEKGLDTLEKGLDASEKGLDTLDPDAKEKSWHNCKGSINYAHDQNLGYKRYVGEYRDGYRHGQGTMTYGGKYEGSIHEGQWRNGLMNGQGTFTTGNTGTKYVGGFKDGRFHGQGSLYSSNGELLRSGEYVNGKRSEDVAAEASKLLYSELKGKYEDYFYIKKCNETHILYVSPDELRQAKKSIRAIDDFYKSKGVDTDAVYKDAESNPSQGAKNLMAQMDVYFIGGWNSGASATCKLFLKSLKKPEKPKGIKDF